VSALLRAENLELAYGEVAVCRGLSLEINEGEIVALIGANGAGKSTTLRAIGAMDVALWDLGGKIAGMPIHRMLGSYRDRAPAYASSAVLPSKEAYAEEAARFKASG